MKYVYSSLPDEAMSNSFAIYEAEVVLFELKARLKETREKICTQSETHTILIVANKPGPEAKSEKERLLLEKKLKPGLFMYRAALGNDTDALPSLGLFPENIDKASSFYCGDMVETAINLGVPFVTRQHHFLDKQETVVLDETSNPVNWVQPASARPPLPSTEAGTPHLIVLVGPPGSGKSTLAAGYAALGYCVVNQDTLKTKAKCLAKCKEWLEAGERVVIDNTNPLKADRNQYYLIAEAHGANVSCIYFDLTQFQVRHMDAHRAATTEVPRLDKVVFHTYFKRLQVPTMISVTIRAIYSDTLTDFSHYYFSSSK